MLGKEGFGFLGGFVGVHVINDEEPAGVEFQPAQGGFDLEGLLLFVLLGEIQDERAARLRWRASGVSTEMKRRAR